MKYYEEYNGYAITSCEKDDIDDVGAFFDSYWAKNHIFYIDREYFNWQFYNKRRDNYNFLIARACDSKEIVGQIAFIPNYLFDDNIKDSEKFIWFSTWMVRPDIRDQGGLGIKLLTSVPAYENTKSVGTSGVYDSVVPLYKMMKFETGSLAHYFILNENTRDFKIACIPFGHTTENLRFSEKSEISIIDPDQFISIFPKLISINKSEFPIKTKTYFINRYFKHPIYKYEIILVKTKGVPKAVFFFRTVPHDSTNVIRIIDGLGNYEEINNIYDDVQKLLSERCAEYIDLYCNGIDHEVLLGAGFTANSVESELIIPNFFEPFERTNRRINYAYYNEHKRRYVIFKGDGDQDRPNIYHMR